MLAGRYDETTLALLLPRCDVRNAIRMAEALRKRVRLVAQTEEDVLVNGAPGSGTSKVAEVIHLSSARSKAPFVKRAAAGLS